jgi:integrase
LVVDAPVAGGLAVLDGLAVLLTLRCPGSVSASASSLRADAFLAMRGVPLKAVQELLGHATIEMTMRYAHQL